MQALRCEPSGLSETSALGRRAPLMFDLAAIAIGLVCFAFVYVVLYVLERV